MVFTKRLNNRKAITTIGGKPAKIILHDQNCNGYFNDVGEDHYFIAPPDAVFEARKAAGAFPLLNDSNLFEYNSQVYDLVKVDSLGKNITIKASDLPFTPPVAPGRPLPDLKFISLNGDSTSFSAYREEGKYLLIDVWGNWCKGCHSSAPDLKELSENYSGKLNLLGLNTGDTPEKATEYLEKYEHTWPQGKLNKEIREILMIDVYPTYILVAPSGDILSLWTDPKKVEEILSQE